MVSLVSLSKTQQEIARNVRMLRLQKGLTQEGLAKRAGVSLASLRKFEQQGAISLSSFLKISMVLGFLEALAEVTRPKEEHFSSIDDVLTDKRNKTPQRGWRK